MPLPSPSLLLLLLLVLLQALLPQTKADCEVHLPVVTTNVSPTPEPDVEVVVDTDPTTRVLTGLKPSVTDYDNIVALQNTGPDDLLDASCAGSLISPSWVLTSAQCLANPGQTTVLVAGATNTIGIERQILVPILHPGWASPVVDVERDDLQLLRLDRPVFTPPPSPSPNGQTDEEQPDDTQTEDSTENPDQPAATDAPVRVRTTRDDADEDEPDPDASPTPTPPPYNVMRLNTNPDFAQDPDNPRFLRIKGFGLRTRPSDGKEILTGTSRPLTFADLLTSSCNDGFGNDGKRRLCTKPDNKCGPCYGDTGAPLYDVDKSGKVSVLVGIVTFGLSGFSGEDGERVCTSDDRPTVYTAIAPYMDWIRETIDEELVEFFVPPEGITNKNLDPDRGLSFAARTSIIVIASLALVGFIGFLLVTCTLRTLRRRRKRWVEGLHAEESFVKGDEKDAGIVDPFEGIIEDHRAPRLSVNSISRAAVKSATEFSARSIGTIKAIIMHAENDEMRTEPREPMDDAPQWLPGAWEKLFRPPSKKDLEHIHTVPAQRVVDDVLEGGDKSVEPSLDSVAFKNARDEANLEAAWKKLEIQTSLRNLSEASGSRDGLNSQAGTVPSTTANSGILVSRNSSRGALSSLLGTSLVGGDGVSNIAKADTLLAAFATIDAESEQVAEETVIDSSTLQALAIAKRPKVLEALRRKFSAGAFAQATSSRANNSEPTSPRQRRGKSRKGAQANTASSTGESNPQPTPALRVGSGPNLTLSTIVNRSGNRVARIASGQGSVNSLGDIAVELGRNSSLSLDYVSEDYSVSSSDEDEPREPRFDFESASRRFTEDRRDGLETEKSLRGVRKTLTRSFEKLEPRQGGAALDDDAHEDRSAAAPAPEIDSVVAEGTIADRIPRTISPTVRLPAPAEVLTPEHIVGSGPGKGGDKFAGLETESVRAEGLMGPEPPRFRRSGRPHLLQAERPQISQAERPQLPRPERLGEIRSKQAQTPPSGSLRAPPLLRGQGSKSEHHQALRSEQSEDKITVRRQGFISGRPQVQPPRRIANPQPVPLRPPQWEVGAEDTSSLKTEDGSMDGRPAAHVEEMRPVSVAALKDMWNEKVRRDSET